MDSFPRLKHLSKKPSYLSGLIILTLKASEGKRANKMLVTGGDLCYRTGTGDKYTFLVNESGKKPRENFNWIYPKQPETIETHLDNLTVSPVLEFLQTVFHFLDDGNWSLWIFFYSYQ